MEFELKELKDYLRKNPHPKSAVLQHFGIREQDLQPYFDNGIIFDTLKGLALLEDYDVHLGTITLRKDNFAYINPVNSLDTKKNDVRVSGKSLEGYIIDDKVYYQIDSWNNATIVGLYKRKEFIAGTAYKAPAGTFFLHTKETAGTDIDVVLTEVPSDLTDGDLVKAKITVNARKSITVRYIETLAKASDVGKDISTIIAENGAPLSFPAEVLAQARMIPQEVSAEEMQGREDFRDKTIVTIDGEDALDFDDAVSCEKIPHGYRIGVYIADVSHYVTPHTPIDEEAEKRGTSIYVADRVVPMLPKELSNGICSLNPDVDRLVLAVIMDVDEVGKVYRSKIVQGIIHSHARLTYTEVNDLFAKNETGKLSEDIVTMLTMMHEATRSIRLRRNKQGSLDLESTELKFSLDKDGNPTEVIKRTQGEGENMIEDLMIIANVEVAKYMDTHKIPTLYRIHENPPSDKLLTFRQFLRNIHMDRDFPMHVTSENLAYWYSQIQDKTLKKTIGNFLLRSLAKARYSPDNEGHFGLAEDDYLHFTSPIRRYPDLIVHRLLHTYVFDKEKFNYSALHNSLETLGQSTSAAERRAVTIERKVDDLESCKYMRRHLKEQYKGIIDGMNAKGMFIELENGIEVFVALRDIDPKTKWVYSDDHLDIQSEERDEETNRYLTYKLGNEVTLYITSVNMESLTVNAMLEAAYQYHEAMDDYDAVVKAESEGLYEKKETSRVYRPSHSHNRKERRSFDHKGTYGHHDKDEKRFFHSHYNGEKRYASAHDDDYADRPVRVHGTRAAASEAEDNRALTRFVANNESIDTKEARRRFYNSPRPSFNKGSNHSRYSRNSHRDGFRKDFHKDFDKKGNFSDKEYSSHRSRSAHPSNGRKDYHRDERSKGERRTYSRKSFHKSYDKK